MNKASATPDDTIPGARWADGLPLALSGALLVLLFSAYQSVGDAVWEMQRSKILHSVLSSGDWGTLLPVQIVSFVWSIVLLYLALGACAWVMAISTHRRLPTTLRQRRVGVLAWLAVLFAWVYLANQTWFPSSDFHSDAFKWVGLEWKGLSFFGVYSALLAGTVVVILAFAIWPSLKQLSVTRIRAGATITLVVSAAAWWFLLHDAISDPAPPNASKPNVIIIGIDSLRCDVTAIDGGESRTPAIDNFLSGAHVFSDAITPLARTFGSWVSILTGRHPVDTNARFNLMPRDSVRHGDTIGHVLRQHGYHAVYATDEVRFANIDERYGFDQLITPRIGASDFLLAKINDLPLSNIVASTRLGEWMFPNTHANRAAYVTYEPADFLRRIDRELGTDDPTFLVAHLTLAHYPYSWAGRSKPTTHDRYREDYMLALSAVDSQFGDLMSILRRKGLLSNAYVVVLSDHGEALGFPSDSLLRDYPDKEMLWNSLWGHGTSVLSPHQFRVVLAMRAYGQSEFPTPPQSFDWPVSLEDIRPTVLELAGVDPGHDLDGSSLASAFVHSDRITIPADRLRYTETDFNTPRVLKGQYDEHGLLKEGAAYYELVPESAWLQIKPERLPELLAQKERAVMDRDWILAALPETGSNLSQFIFASRSGGLAMRLHAAPDPVAQPEAARLWEALHRRFSGEI